MFTKIDHIAFTVKDREKSIRFYERLGFRQYFEHDVPAPEIEKIVYLELGGTVLELVHMPHGSCGAVYHFCLASDDFDADVARLNAAGASVRTAPHPTTPRKPGEEGWRRVVFTGPDGEAVEFRG